MTLTLCEFVVKYIMICFFAIRPTKVYIFLQLCFMCNFFYFPLSWLCSVYFAYFSILLDFLILFFQSL